MGKIYKALPVIKICETTADTFISAIRPESKINGTVVAPSAPASHARVTADANLIAAAYAFAH